MTKEVLNMHVIDLRPELLRLDEVGRILGIGRTKLATMVRHEELPAVRIGRLVRVRRTDLDDWIAQRVHGARVA